MGLQGLYNSTRLVSDDEEVQADREEHHRLIEPTIQPADTESPGIGRCSNIEIEVANRENWRQQYDRAKGIEVSREPDRRTQVKQTNYFRSLQSLRD